MVFEKTDSSESNTLQEQSDLLRGMYRFDNVKTLRIGAVTLCQGQSGWADALSGDAVDAHSYVMESVVSYADNTWYAVTYTRRAEDPDDVAAVATLNSLCPKT